MTIGAAPRPPRFVANNGQDVTEIANSAAAVSVEQLAESRGFRNLQISAIPYLRASPAGAQFLQQAAPRALARGEPAANCPASTPSSDGSLDNRDAAASALGGCLAQLSRRDADSECGCRIIAINDFLLAPQTDFAFAPVVSALLIRPDGSAERLVAESLRPENATELVSLRTIRGEIGRLILADERAVMRLNDPDEINLSGTRTIFGYRRGRLAERLVLTAEDGARYTLLIGIEMRDAEAAR